MSVQSEIDRIKKNVDDTLKVIGDTGVTVGTGSDALPAAARALANEKQNKLTGTAGQFVGFDAEGNAQAQDVSASGIPTSEKGAANGVATLGDDGKVPAEQLPAMDYAPSSHVSDTTKHITADERAAWNAKASTAYVDEAVQTAIGNAIGGSY